MARVWGRLLQPGFAVTRSRGPSFATDSDEQDHAEYDRSGADYQRDVYCSFFHPRGSRAASAQKAERFSSTACTARLAATTPP